VVTPEWNWEDVRVWCVRAAHRYVGATAAEDVAHEALIRAWRRRHTCRQPNHPWPWLAQILHNEAMRYLARTSDTVPISDGSPDDSCVDDVIDRLALEAMMEALPEPDRLVLRLHYELDLSVASMAEVLDVSEGAVKVRLHRARARLRSTLPPAP
jgi:RNA polymerase sigma factor (sigma-70 family)